MSRFATLLLTIVISGCAVAPSPLAGNYDIDSDGPFSLTIATATREYEAEQPIDAVAQLAYAGPQPEAMLSGSGSGPILFGIEQLDGPIDNGFGQHDDCRPHPIQRDDPMVTNFQKSGGWDGDDDPMAEFWTEYFSDPELRLTAGSYRLIARVDISVGAGCSSEHLELNAQVDIAVR